MEEMRELAGNLKAELMEARLEWMHNRMSTEDFKARIDLIRAKREMAQTQWRLRHPVPQPMLQMQAQA